MKAISIKQPWASLICDGIKDIENRTWAFPKKYIGQRVLVHASAKIDKDAVNFISKIDGELARKIWFDINDNKLITGAIIGSVEIADCLTNHPSLWAEKLTYSETLGIVFNPIYNWVLANPVLFPEPIPAKGKLSFWDYPNILAEPEEKNGKLFCHCQIPVKEENKVMSLGNGEYICRYCGGRWYK